MIMLLVGPPVLIEAKVARNFLEQAQRLGGEMTRTLATMAKTPEQATTSAGIDDALERLRAALAPLVQPLNSEELIAAGGNEAR
jgi:hypothetical protein